MGEFALRVGAGALGALELAAHLQLEPARVFGVHHVIEIHVNHGHSAATGAAGRGRRRRRRRQQGRRVIAHHHNSTDRIHFLRILFAFLSFFFFL